MHFVLVCEGPSDSALVPHLRLLLVDCGVKQVTGAAPDFRRLPNYASRSISAKVSYILKLEENFDLLFVHRDADSADPESRYTEISRGIIKAGFTGTWIGVVPVHEIEAWLLLDERAIRRASGRPRGRGTLPLPAPNHVENIANPKELLDRAIIIASEATGRRLSGLKSRIPRVRGQLLGELRPNGPLLLLRSWLRLKTDVELSLGANLSSQH